MKTSLQDLHHALRLLRRKPGFAAICVITLGLGIGANTAIYSVVNSYLLKPLPYAEADRLGMIQKNPDNADYRSVYSYPVYRD